ncbi:MAG: VCBS repeat-containing protein [Acidobacteriota bacterium]|nr:VCBS repeat-containing protein [Acidobacteriota bacterium]
MPLRRGLSRILSLGVLLSGGVGPAAAQSTSEAAEFAFTQYEVVTGSAKRQTVLTGFLLGGASAELVVVDIDDGDERRLRIYEFGDGAWVPGADATLGPDVRFVDVANIGGRDRLLTYDPGRLNWFDPESATERALVAVTANFNPPRGGEVPHVDVSRDVNGDGRDDLVVPGVDGFWVFIQTSAAEFADPVKIGRSTDLSRIYGADGYRYNPWEESRVHEMDYDLDGRRDLVFWNEDHFAVHHQDEDGLFSPVAETFTTDVAFDSDGLSSLATGDMTGRVLHSIADLNGDGIGDLVVFSLEGASISRKRSTCEVHLGAPAPDGGTRFARAVDFVFQSDGRIQLGMNQRDFDGDGDLDLMFTTIELAYLESSLWKRLKGFMGDDVWLDLEFYPMREGLHSDEPNAIRRMQLDGHPSVREFGWVPLDIVLRGAMHEERKTQKRHLRAFNTTLLIGDLTGDGRSDLLIEETHRKLLVFAGVPGPDLFTRQPQRVAVAIPNDEEYTWLVDLNRDGKQDLLMHHASTTEPHRVKMLVAR